MNTDFEWGWAEAQADVASTLYTLRNRYEKGLMTKNEYLESLIMLEGSLK